MLYGYLVSSAKRARFKFHWLSPPQSCTTLPICWNQTAGTDHRQKAIWPSAHPLKRSQGRNCLSSCFCLLFQYFLKYQLSSVPFVFQPGIMYAVEHIVYYPIFFSCFFLFLVFLLRINIFLATSPTRRVTLCASLTYAFHFVCLQNQYQVFVPCGYILPHPSLFVNNFL